MLGLILILIAIVLLFLELFTTSTFLVFVAIGFLASGIAAFFTSNYIILILIGMIVTFLSITILRDKYVKKLSSNKVVRTSYEEVLGKEAVVIKEFQGKGVEMGAVKAGNMEWSAQSDEDHLFTEGSIVEVVRIDGVKLIVKEIK